MGKEQQNKCKNCTHWKNRQRELNYWDSTGFCLNPKFNFNTNDGRLIGVVDLDNIRNRTKVIGNCSHDFETGQYGNINHSRYLLATEEEFGCNYFDKR